MSIRTLSFNSNGDSIITETPLSCTRLQARIVLGEDLCKVIDDMADDPNTPWGVKQMIQYATVWERDLPEINAIGEKLGLTSDQIDSLFMEAMQV